MSKIREQLSTAPNYPKPVVTVHNGTPSDWELYITEVACRFFYRRDDGSMEDEIRGTGPINVPSGKNAEVAGTKTHCCKAIKTIVEVTMDGEVYVLEDSVAADPNECLISVPYNIGPTVAIVEGSQRVEDRLVLVRLDPWKNGHVII